MTRRGITGGELDAWHSGADYDEDFNKPDPDYAQKQEQRKKEHEDWQRNEEKNWNAKERKHGEVSTFGDIYIYSLFTSEKYPGHILIKTGRWYDSNTPEFKARIIGNQTMLKNNKEEVKLKYDDIVTVVDIEIVKK